MHIVPPLIPTGTVFPFAGPSASIPNGWLHCNGAAVSRTVYSHLFAVLGISHGQGDGGTTFNIPNYQGLFLRGVDGGVGNDPDRAGRTAMAGGGNTGDNVGSVQADAFKAHRHLVNFGTGAGGQQTTNQASPSAGYNDPLIDTGGNETRPKNAGVHYMIKV